MIAVTGPHSQSIKDNHRPVRVEAGTGTYLQTPWTAAFTDASLRADTNLNALHQYARNGMPCWLGYRHFSFT
jgi:hypothetical protein